MLCSYCGSKLRPLPVRLDWANRKFHLSCIKKKNLKDIVDRDFEIYLQSLPTKT